jgi:hypothetical protein
MFGVQRPRELAVAALHVFDLDGAGDPTLMFNPEAHGIAHGPALGAPKGHIAVLWDWLGGRNTHLCTLGEE